MTKLNYVSLAVCLVVAAGIAVPAAVYADHHEADTSLTADSVAAPARASTETDGTLSVEGTGIQEVEAAARSLAGEGTDSVEGTGVMQIDPATGTTDGTHSVEGTGLMEAAPATPDAEAGTESVEGTGLMRSAPVGSNPGEGAESVEGTGLMDATLPHSTPVTEAMPAATPAVEEPSEDE